MAAKSDGFSQVPLLHTLINDAGEIGQGDEAD